MLKKTLPFLLAALLGSTGVAAAQEPDAMSSLPAPAYPAATPAQLSSGADWASSNALITGSGPLFDPNDPFYIPPADLPSTPGTLLRTQPAPHLLNIAGPTLPGYAEKILYTSTTTHGETVAVSGYVIEPTTRWAGEGPTPTIVVAPGTRGAADSCAPSRTAGLVGAADPAGLTANVNYESPFQYAASNYGMRVVVTDYIGLGTPGVHTYVDNTEQAHAVLDAARAGLAAAGVPADSPVGFFGYSQGGGAVAAAAEHAAAYAPELNIKGTYAGAPPANLEAVLQAVDGSGIVGVFGYAIAGYSDRYPELKQVLDEKLNDRGKAFVAENANSCIVDSALQWALTDTTKFTVTGQSMSEVASEDPIISGIFARESLGKTSPTGPVMLGSSSVDDIIPNDQVRALGNFYCNSGSAVYLNGSPLGSLTSSVPLGADHAAGLFTDTPKSLNYLIDRFNNQPAPNSCGSF